MAVPITATDLISPLLLVKALLAWGNRRYPKQYYSGYPNLIAGGQFSRGIAAINASEAPTLPVVTSACTCGRAAGGTRAGSGRSMWPAIS